MSSSTPRLVGAHEIRVRLGGISRQRVYQITAKLTFPKPLAELAAGKVWDQAAVEAWITANRPHQDDVY